LVDFIGDLNPVQQEAVRTEGGPLLVLAGAGSGKTRVLTYRVAYLVSELGVSPRRILAVTFTNKAADEMRRRVAALIGGDVGAAWIGTFHSVCARILRLEAQWGWWTPAYSIYDEADQLDVVKESMEAVGVSASTFAPRVILGAISRAKDRLLSAEAYAEQVDGCFEECVAKIYAEYQKRLVASNALDFDDLIMQTVDLLRGNPPVLEAYSERFEHVLVDEYQDTSHAQYVLVDLLSSKHRNICVVGDDDQSIYGWRGADISNILDFERDHPDARVLRLEQNYRSTKSILAAAHDVISRNERRKEKRLWTERQEGRKPLLTLVPNEYREADRIRDRIVERSRGAGLAYRDFAVLYRTHAQSRVIEDSLRRAGIPYDIVGGVRFYERAEVKDILAYLRVAANPSDAVSLRRIINVPPRKVGGKSMALLEEYAAKAGRGLLDAVARAEQIDGMPAAAKRSLAELAGVLSRLASMAERAPVDDVLRSVLADTGYASWLERQGTEEAAQRLANVEELVSAAAEFVELSDDPSLAAFLAQVALVADIDQWEDQANTVSLMTLHNAKGLEFPVVMIPGLEEGLLPHDAALEDDSELEEERRLFYVGMTRAKEEVYLFAADTRRRGGVFDARAASRFIDEIDSAHIEVESDRGYVSVPRSRRGAWRRSFAPRPRDDVFPDYEGLSQEPVEIIPGARVAHPKWGEGVVLETSGAGLDAVVRVRFEDGEEKRIMVRYGKLTVLNA